jgi:hypothetical protein
MSPWRSSPVSAFWKQVALLGDLAGSCNLRDGDKQHDRCVRSLLEWLSNTKKERNTRAACVASRARGPFSSSEVGLPSNLRIRVECTMNAP